VDKYYQGNQCGFDWETSIMRHEGESETFDPYFLECNEEDVQFILDCLNGRHDHGANGL